MHVTVYEIWMYTTEYKTEMFGVSKWEIWITEVSSEISSKYTLLDSETAQSRQVGFSSR